jgi:hypothetical protein
MAAIRAEVLAMEKRGNTLSKDVYGATRDWSSESEVHIRHQLGRTPQATGDDLEEVFGPVAEKETTGRAAAETAGHRFLPRALASRARTARSALRTFRAALKMAARSGDSVLEADIQGTMCELLLFAGWDELPLIAIGSAATP